MSADGIDLFIDHLPGETRCAAYHNDLLIGVHIDNMDMPYVSGLSEGNIYLGRITTIAAHLQAAFVDIGLDKEGFLPASTISGTGDISQKLRVGESLLVQLKRPPLEEKGAALSATLELESPHMVLTPQRPGLNISKKITDEKLRENLRESLKPHLAGGYGLVLRTQAANCHATQLIDELHDLQARYEAARESDAQAPALLQSPTPFLKTICALYPNISSIKVDGLAALQELQRYGIQAELSQPSGGLFKAYDIEGDIEQLCARHHPLPGGGHLVIEPTTALWAVDVNMAERKITKDRDASARELNLEAITALAPLISQRNIAGQIVIDFVKMRKARDKTAVEQALKKALSNDPLCLPHGLSRMGLGEVSRTRRGFELSAITNSPMGQFCVMMRRLSHEKHLKALQLGPGLYGLWQTDKTRKTRLWLRERLGRDISASKQSSLAPYSFEIET